MGQSSVINLCDSVVADTCSIRDVPSEINVDGQDTSHPKNQSSKSNLSNASRRIKSVWQVIFCLLRVISCLMKSSS